MLPTTNTNNTCSKLQMATFYKHRFIYNNMPLRLFTNGTFWCPSVNPVNWEITSYFPNGRRM